MFNLSMIMSPAFKAFIANTLTEEQQIWLTQDLTNRPLGVPEFFLSRNGQEALQSLMEEYMKYSNGGTMPDLPKVKRPDELWVRNLNTGKYEKKK